jgi:hypothetical protein
VEMQRTARTVQPEFWRAIRARNTMDSMFTASKPILLLLLALTIFGASAEKRASARSSESPEYTADGQLKLPEHFREWVWLTSDFHAASDPANMQAGEHRLFNNVFVNPEAYKAFLQTGTWPDKTMLVVEQRAPEDIVSPNPNAKGNAQSSVLGLAMHVKDETRFPGKWAFFDFKGSTTAGVIPVTAHCYSCHASRGAADTTFIQFYPTLLPIAKSKDTLSVDFKRGTEGSAPTTK